MMPCHQYQREMVAKFSKSPVLNGACKEDPSNLGRDFNATNMDVNDYDPQERLSLYQIPNFVRGSLLNIPFPDRHFGTVVLGEILEHCPRPSAIKILSEAKRVVKSDGVIVVTYPLDPRPANVQHEPHLLITWEGGITSWHQSVWDSKSFEDLLNEVGLEQVPDLRVELQYGFCTGIGTVLRIRNADALSD